MTSKVDSNQMLDRDHIEMVAEAAARMVEVAGALDVAAGSLEWVLDTDWGTDDVADAAYRLRQMVDSLSRAARRAVAACTDENGGAQALDIAGHMEWLARHVLQGFDHESTWWVVDHADWVRSLPDVYERGVR